MVRVNFRLLFKLVLVALAFGGGIYGLYAYQSQRIPAAMLWQANNAAEQGKTDEAMKYIRRYLELNPDDHDQTLKLADLIQTRATSVKDLTNSLYLYEKVMREAPERVDAARKFVFVCVRLGRHADGLRVAEEVVRRSPNDGELLGNMAECLVGMNKFPEARKKFEEALRLAPENVRAHEQFARLLMFKLGLPKDALSVLDQLVKTNPASAEAHLLRARTLHAEREDPAAMRDLDRVFWLDPENIEAMLLASEIDQVGGRTRRARETLLALLDTAPRDVRGYRALSWLNLLSGNSIEAVQTLERGLVRLPDAPELLTPLGDLSLDQGDVEKTTDIIRRLEARQNAGAQAKYLRGRLLMRQGKHRDAIEVLEPLRAEVLSLAGVEQQVSLLLSACHERCGNFGVARETLKRMLAKDPGNLPARVAMGNLMLDAGQIAEASREYDVAGRSPIAGVGVRIMAARLRMKRLEADPKAKPDDWNTLEDDLRELIKQQPNAIEPVTILADARAGRGEAGKGMETLREACRKRPSDSRLWIALANLAWREEGALRAAEILNEARAVSGDSVEWKLARAGVLTAGLEPLTLDKLAGATSPLSETERLRLWQGLVDILSLAGLDEPMLAACRELSRVSSRDVNSRRLLFMAALRSKDVGAEQRWGRELREAAPNGETLVTLIRALEESAGAKLPEARLKELNALALQAVRNAPEMIEGRWLAARVAAGLGDRTAAGELYFTAAQMDPLNINLVVERLQLMRESGQDAPFEQGWSAVLHDPRLTHNRRLAAGRLLGRDVITKLKSNTDHWARTIVSAAGKGLPELQASLKEAEAALGRERCLGMLATVRKALVVKHADWRPEIRSSEEMRSFAAAAVAHAEFIGQPRESLAVLQALASDKNARPEDAQWAAQAVAAIRWQSGDSEGAKPDPAELKTLVERKPQSIAEHRARVQGLTAAFRGAEGMAREPILAALIESLRELTADASATVGDWYQLSQVYRGIGDRSNARRCLGELLKKEPNNLQYLAINVEELLSEGRLDEAEPLIASLQPGVHDLRVAGALARYLTLVNDARGVLETTDRFVKAVDAGSGDGVIRQRQAAELLDQLCRLSLARHLSGGKILLEGACERYRAVSLQYPESIGGWVALLALNGQADKALEELERRQSRLGTADLAAAGMRTLRDSTPTDKQFKQVSAWLAKALAEDPKSVNLMLQQAEWHTMQTQFDEAATLYRRVLESDGNQPVALNNLAWILAANPATAAEALKLVERAVRLSGVNPEILDTRARILISAGRFPEARQSLHEALNASQTALRYFHLALWHIRQDQKDEALKIMREAVRLGIDLRQVHPSDRELCKELSARVN